MGKNQKNGKRRKQNKKAQQISHALSKPRRKKQLVEERKQKNTKFSIETMI